MYPGAPLTYFNDGGGGPKRDSFGYMKDAGILLGRQKNTGIISEIVFLISSNQQ